MVGGYKLIDFKSTNLVTGAETPPVISGIYNDIENNYRKAIMLTGLVIDGVEKNNTYAECIQAENACTFTVYSKTITVTNEDKVTVA